MKFALLWFSAFLGASVAQSNVNYSVNVGGPNPPITSPQVVSFKSFSGPFKHVIILSIDGFHQVLFLKFPWTNLIRWTWQHMFPRTLNRTLCVSLQIPYSSTTREPQCQAIHSPELQPFTQEPCPEPMVSGTMTPGIALCSRTAQIVLAHLALKFSMMNRLT